MDYNYDIKDDLKSRSEYFYLETKFRKVETSGIARNEIISVNSVTVDMILDIIVFYSKGSRVKATKFLKLTQQLVDRCITFLEPSFPSNEFRRAFWAKNIVVQIWSYGFILKRCLCELGFFYAKFEIPAEVVIQNLLVKMNEEDLLKIAGHVGDAGRRNYFTVRREIIHLRRKKDYYNAKFQNGADRCRFYSK